MCWIKLICSPDNRPQENRPQENRPRENPLGLLVLAIAVGSSLVGCSGGRLLAFPFDPIGLNPNSLNSGFAEVEPSLGGRYIAFVSDRRGSADIYLYDWQQRRLVDLPGLNAIDAIEASPSVSDDGNWLVFTATRQGRTGLFVYDRANQQKRQLRSNDAAVFRHPVLSADGQRIAVEIERFGQWHLVVFDREGRPIATP